MYSWLKTQLNETLRAAMMDKAHIAGRVVPIIWDESTARILRVLIEEDVVSTSDLHEWVDLMLRRAARFCYRECKEGVHPDHTVNPVALAYAIAQNEFSEKEIKYIQFDMGQTSDEFVAAFTPHGGTINTMIAKLTHAGTRSTEESAQ